MNTSEDPTPTLTIPEILARFSRIPKDGLPRAALAAAVAQREQITPELLARSLAVFERGASSTAEEGWLLTYSLMLLAEFREPLALPLLLRILRLPDDDREILISDSLTEDMPRWLAAVHGGRVASIKALVEDDEVDGIVRWCGLRALVVMVAMRELTRDEVLGYLRELCGKLEREENDLWLGVVDCAINLHPGPLLEELRRLFAEGLVDEQSFRWRDVEESDAYPLDFALAQLPLKERPFTTAADELARWHCFHPDFKWKDEAEDFEGVDLPEESPLPSLFSDYAPPPLPYVASPKVGRNDPCPCGSGKKYKKCCLNSLN
jgi:hypothetical protein